MTYPYFSPGIDNEKQSLRAEDVPTLDQSKIDDPAEYIPNENLSHAINVALILGMPLLVTGEPGTGKTQLAYAIGHQLQCKVHKFETKSTSTSKDLFYTYDAIGAFKKQSEVDHRLYIRYQALGRAILEAFPSTERFLEKMLAPESSSDFNHQGPRRSIVLIDEIDKAPRDFPNDLLNEIERLYFRVPELHNIGSPGADNDRDGVPIKYRPIIIMTSNSEKGLPDPFLRRCVYYNIPFPDKEQMSSIINARISRISTSDPLLKDALDFFYSLRSEASMVSLIKQPSTSELINWLQVLLNRQIEPNHQLKTKKKDLLKKIEQTLCTLLKNSNDLETASNYLEIWASE